MPPRPASPYRPPRSPYRLPHARTRDGAYEYVYAPYSSITKESQPSHEISEDDEYIRELMGRSGLTVDQIRRIFALAAFREAYNLLVRDKISLDAEVFTEELVALLMRFHEQD